MKEMNCNIANDLMKDMEVVHMKDGNILYTLWEEGD